MNARPICVLALLVLFAGVGPVAAEPAALWRSIMVGMTETEVKRLIPEARANEAPSSNEDGWIDLLVARLRTGSRDQKVTFQFQEGRVAGIVVSEGEPFGVLPIAQRVAKARLAEAHKAYGTPVRCRDTEDGFHACFWINRGVFIGYLERRPPTSAVMQFFHAVRPSDSELLR